MCATTQREREREQRNYTQTHTHIPFRVASPKNTLQTRKRFKGKTF